MLNEGSMDCIRVPGYIRETLRFIESAEMREYLLTIPEQLGRNKCAEIVSNAPAPLERKIPILGLIAAQTPYDPERDFGGDPAKLAEEARFALKERYNDIPGAVFLLMLNSTRKRSEECTPFTAFDAAMRHLHNIEKTENRPDRVNDVWYRIEKWIPSKNGEMKCLFSWILNANGEIWYFNCEYGSEPEGWTDFFNYIGDMNLPVPFQPGDIVLADCRPFNSEQTRVLILDVTKEREWDCCHPVCLYVHDGKLDASALKHHFFLRDIISHVSVLYRASRYTGELPESEAPLAVLSGAIKARPKFGVTVFNSICGCESWSGIDWEPLKEKLGL